MKSSIRFLIFIFCLFGLVACTNKPSDANTIKIGTIAGPETELMEIVKEVAKQKYNLNIEIVQFTDYVMPNQALADGSIDANMFQHQPYLDEMVRNKNYPIVAIGKTFIYPMGIYSKKINNLSALKTGAIVAIPNDPSNEARALLLLQTAGLIQLKNDVTINATPNDIESNPKQLVFKELDAAQLPRILNDVDIAAINTNYAMVAGLLPSKDALFKESPNSPYANIVVVRMNEKDLPKFHKLMEALHSPEVTNKANKLFQGQAIAAWQ